ncbi:MAG: hypothetical protein VX436_00455, partial [Planctomycetota bacterium]|nr:hypothetical protein [Planctomycetota bacterium]
MNKVTVCLDNRSYEIFIGSNILGNIKGLINEAAAVSSYFFVLDHSIEDTHGVSAMQSFDGSIFSCVIEAVESEKTLVATQK